MVKTHGTGSEQILIVACSDGAGSASEAQVASEMACRVIVDQIEGDLERSPVIAEISEARALNWFAATHQFIVNESVRREIALRQFSATLLIGIIGSGDALFAQIGDGAIVVSDGSQNSRYCPVFWPDSGEYHNTTYFIADPKFTDHLNIRRFHQPITEAAFLTDGLQMLALDYAAKAAHAPFFIPMFNQLRQQPQSDLIHPMRQFLDSQAVNDLTDDDKTLVVAVRSV